MALDNFNPYLFVSAGEQSNKFLTPAYAGGIAQFQSQRAQSLTGLTVRIDPIQEGTGDPSPTNIRHISGWTGMTVTRAGKNLLKPQMAQGTSSIVVLGQSDATSFGTFLKAGTYTISVQSSKSFAFYYRAENGTESVRIGGYNVTSATFTLTEDLRIRLYAYLNAGLSVSDISNPQLELGSTATAYEPYDGQAYPISWQTEAGTVYGGTLDVVSGVLTVDRGINVIDGTQAIGTNGIQAYGGIQTRYTPTPAKAFAPSTAMQNYGLMSDKFETTQAYADSEYQATGRSVNANVYFNMPTSVTTAAQAREWFTNNPTQLVYELATPQTYQLSPTDVKTLAGFNQIYSDAGPIIGIKF